MAIGFFVTLLGFSCTAWWVAGSLVQPANRHVGEPPNDLPINEMTLQSESGSNIATWYIQTENSHATVILLHQIRSDRRSMLSRARLLLKAGFSIVMIDFQAHGESPGEMITAGYKESHDVRAAVEFARKKNPDHRIGIVGCSLGGAATLMASPLEIDAVVLEAVYPTISEAIHNRIAIRMGPLSYILSPALTVQMPFRMGVSASDLRPIDYVSEIGCPVLVLAGELDRHTTLDESRRIFAAAKEPKEMVVFDGAAHVDFLKFASEKYEKPVVKFLVEHLKISSNELGHKTNGN